MNYAEVYVLDDVAREGCHVTVWWDELNGLLVSYPSDATAERAYNWLLNIVRNFAYDGEVRRSTKPTIYVYGEEMSVGKFLARYESLVEVAGYHTEIVRESSVKGGENIPDSN